MPPKAFYWLGNNDKWPMDLNLIPMKELLHTSRINLWLFHIATTHVIAQGEGVVLATKARHTISIA